MPVSTRIRASGWSMTCTQTGMISPSTRKSATRIGVTVIEASALIVRLHLTEGNCDCNLQLVAGLHNCFRIATSFSGGNCGRGSPLGMPHQSHARGAGRQMELDRGARHDVRKLPALPRTADTDLGRDRV